MKKNFFLKILQGTRSISRKFDFAWFRESGRRLLFQTAQVVLLSYSYPKCNCSANHVPIQWRFVLRIIILSSRTYWYIYMNHLVALITFLAFISPAYSQQIFETVVGSGGDDVGYSVRQTSDGFTVVGYTTNSNTGKDWYLVELDSAGVVVNSKYDKLLSDQ